MNLSDADKMMIGLCSLVALGLLSSHISVLWARVKEFFNQFFSGEEDWS